MIKIEDKKKCCGCTACVQVCPKQCIVLIEDTEGFLYPKVNKKLCVECGACENVCPFTSTLQPRMNPLVSYAAKNRDEDVRKESSSGGIFTALAENVINEGGVVFGVRFDEKWNPVFDYTETVDGLAAFRGSKYVQSTVGDSFKQVRSFLKANRKVLFSGTPCQVAGLKLFLRHEYDNLLTVEVVCHGVPSPGVWRKYLEEKVAASEAAAGKSTDLHSLNDLSSLEDIRFREKSHGWKKYRFVLKFAESSDEGKKSSDLSLVFNDSEWGKPFVKNLFLRPSCHVCKVKSFASGADMTIADFWGIEKVLPLFDDDRGCSAVIIHTEKAKMQFQRLNCDKLKVDIVDIIAGNSAIVKSWKASPNRERFFEKVSKGRSVVKAIREETAITTKEKIKRRVKNSFVYKICRIFKNRAISVVEKVDLVFAKILSFVLVKKPDASKAILFPADSIIGGFGEDIMVAGFLNLYTEALTIAAPRIDKRFFIENRKNVDSITFSKGLFKYLKLVLLLRKYEKVYLIGADVLDGVYNVNKEKFYIIEYAHQLHLQVNITGFSIRETPSEYFKNAIHKVENYTMIKARDGRSYHRLSKIVQTDHLMETVDIAFACGVDEKMPIEKSAVEWVKAQKEKGQKIIAYCPNTIQAKKMGLNEYLRCQLMLLKEFSKQNCSILFLYHDLRKYALGINDKELSKMVSFYFQENGMFCDNITDGYLMKNYINLADFTVTGRMHFGISGYTLNKPMFGCCYYNKFEGVQDLFGIKPENSLVDYDKIHENLFKVTDFLGFLPTYQACIKRNLSSVQNCAQKNI